MTQPTAMPVISAPVRKPRKEDNVEEMVGKLTVRINSIVGHDDQKDKMWKDMQALQDRSDRVGLVKLYGRIGQYIGRLADEAAAYQRYLEATEPVRVANEVMLKAVETYVAAENAKGHKGLLALMRAELVADEPAYCSIAKIQDRIGNLWPEGKDDIEPLLGDLDRLTFAIDNFVWTDWCKRCGAPVEKITPRGEGKKSFVPSLCKACYTAEPEPKAASPKKASAPKKPAAPQQSPEALKAVKRARQLEIEKNRQQELAELQNLHPGQYRDGKAKKAKDAAKENRKQGGDPDREKGKVKKSGKKKGSDTKPE